MRLFVAIPLPEPIKRRIYNLRDESLPVRWAKPDTYHLTLKFIGEVEDTLVEQIRDALFDVPWSEPFEIELAQAGAFPSAERPRVIWCGVRPQEPVITLQEKIVRVLDRFEITGDDKSYHPHVTFGRVKKPIRAVSDFIRLNENSIIGHINADRFCLYSSELKKGGAVHTVIETYTAGNELSQPDTRH